MALLLKIEKRHIFDIFT